METWKPGIKHNDQGINFQGEIYIVGLVENYFTYSTVLYKRCLQGKKPPGK